MLEGGVRMKDYKNPISSYQIKLKTQDAKKLKEYWSTGIGLNRVDGLQPSDYLVSLAKKHIDGDISSEKVNNELKDYYNNQNINNEAVRQTMECDLVSKRIVDLLDSGSFTFSPQMLRQMHGYLFKDIINYRPGEYRDYDITKKEDVLYGESVNYGSCISIKDNLNYDFGEEKGYRYSYPMNQKDMSHLIHFVSNVWQAHPFCEGNTRTTAVFTELYLRNMGYDVNNDMFQNEAQYFRDALVRNNYTNVKCKVYETNEFLNFFFDNLINHADHKLNRSDLFCRSIENTKQIRRENEKSIHKNQELEL